ncbi:protein of unknown function DUF454 [Xylanimonas cellulosilytica DSM 15894]|uniref:DUF454 domain-containing protein n=1 Tax=Xylanimonas cellulosilytica (strain DSM 15894 / JCM 12276 / CECT 5975 / KCTC 9989 / LMG 20990 / NBRC 107835 / XIL07) TaxID=446471 RepID=D1BZE9_XYLCX|nr:protein of unknown function DUF454 [Xylanimonas cellulosilytica DSM 15894]
MTQLHDARATSWPPAPETGRSRARSVRRAVYNALGMVCVALGVIGVFVPVWPTTGFVILASILFSRANPRMYTWLLTSRMLGPYLQNWYHKTGIPMSYKIRTCVLLWAGLGVSMIFVSTPWLYALLAVVGIAVTWHVFAIRTRRAGPVATADGCAIRDSNPEPAD